jgi:hypothetical protein
MISIQTAMQMAHRFSQMLWGAAFRFEARIVAMTLVPMIALIVPVLFFHRLVTGGYYKAIFSKNRS